MFTGFRDNPLFNRWPNGLIALNKRGQILAFSAQAESLLGYQLAEESQLEEDRHPLAHDLLCTQDRQHIHSIDQCPLSQYPNHNTDLQTTVWKKRDGHYISVDFRIIPLDDASCAYLIDFVDNSDRLHSQAEMLKYTEYVNKSPSAIAEFDRYGQILFGNAAMHHLIDQFDFNDIGVANIFPEQIEALCQQALSAANIEVVTAESQVEDRFYNWHFQPLQTHNEATVMGYAFDITEQKLAEQIAAKQKEQLRKEYIAKMVHELRTPLNAIVGFSNILISRAKNKLADHELERLKAIKNAGLQLNYMVTNTLDFSKIESGKMTLEICEFAIADVCESLREQMATLAQQKGLIYRQKLLTDKTICSDQTKVQQILTNLISNAVKYTKEGKVFLMLVESVHPELNECFSIVVLDTGIGIPEDQIPTLFDSYEQVSSAETRNIQGTGLGLALVKDLVDLLGGRINVISTVGVGSSFEVILPYAAHLNDES